MIRPLTLLGLCLVVALFSGCRSKPRPDLYRPGDIQAWRTVDQAAAQRQAEERPRVAIQTSQGTFTVELFENEAPLSVANFLQYMREGFYEGTVFHRVIPGFMVQGGGMTADLAVKPTRAAIRNEAGNGLPNMRGTLAMARTDEINSATSQFFVNLVDNGFLNGDGIEDGYAVFGRVVEGMDVIDRIAFLPTGTAGGMPDVPVEPVLITGMRRVE